MSVENDGPAVSGDPGPGECERVGAQVPGDLLPEPGLTDAMLAADPDVTVPTSVGPGVFSPLAAILPGSRSGVMRMTRHRCRQDPAPEPARPHVSFRPAAGDRRPVLRLLQQRSVNGGGAKDVIEAGRGHEGVEPGTEISDRGVENAVPAILGHRAEAAVELPERRFRLAFPSTVLRPSR